MGERVIHVMTHDSIGLGEDGPTHQPVEHLAALRAIPNLLRVPSLRRGRDRRVLAARARAEGPAERAGADAPEPAAASHRTSTTDNRLRRAAPTRSPRPDGKADVSIFATGSEVAIAVDGAEAARRQGHRGARRLGAVLRAVPGAAGRGVPPRHDRRRPVKVGVEAAVRQGWDAIIGSDGAFVGMTGFGASAPYKDLYKHFGITAEAVAEAALSKLGKVTPSYCGQASLPRPSRLSRK